MFGTCHVNDGWHPDEDLCILVMWSKIGSNDWNRCSAARISAVLPGRSPDDVIARFERLAQQHGIGNSPDGRHALDNLLHSVGIESEA